MSKSKTKTKKKNAGTKAAADVTVPKLSQIAAAAQVLKKAGKAMNCKTLVAAMAAQGLWKSPAGKTPHATLSATIGHEIDAKGAKARFKKIGPGMFAARG